MWSAIQAWFESKGGAAHVVVVLYLGAVAAYAAVPAFADLLNVVYGMLPVWAHEVLLAAIGVIAWYKNTQAAQAFSGTSTPSKG